LSDLTDHDDFLDGFFDAGMLLQALKARGDAFDQGESKPSERAAANARRRDVGKKLRLVEY
jgi:carnitine O-acetyltransferase